ncbi:MAG: JAB domain-containing protein [Candidatus Aminicenantes bacterium]|jgi:DNA repair protein RadC
MILNYSRLKKWMHRLIKTREGTEHEKVGGNDKEAKKTPTKKLLKSGFDGYEYKGLQIKLKLELVGYGIYEPFKVCGPKAVYELFKRLGESDKERLYSVHFDSKFNVIGVELVSQGTADETYLFPREVFKSALLSSASGIILVHCHPADNPLPSILDVRVTDIIQTAGDILGVPVIDHVIIGRDSMYSFKKNVQKVEEYSL